MIVAAFAAVPWWGDVLIGWAAFDAVLVAWYGAVRRHGGRVFEDDWKGD